jgi:benzoyl-CoA reductase/2-hydroxyglutaryl-CoA dehydratase subunit BcrC/BadD/HgdB
MTKAPDVLQQMNFSLEGYRMAMAGLNSPGLNWAFDCLSDYFGQVSAAADEGRPLAWINFGMPSDLVPVVVEVVNGLLAPTPQALRYIDLAEEVIPDYVCSSNKLYLGAMRAGDVPVPAVMVHPAHPCDSNLAVYPVMAETFGYPHFCVDMPYVRSAHGLEYVAGELAALVAFLEETTGHRLDPDRLREVMALSNRAHVHALELAELRRAVPTPYSSLDNLAEYPLMLCLAGTPELEEYYAKRLARTREAVARGDAFMPGGEERIRMAWIYGAPAYDLLFFLRLEQEHGAVAVANMNNNFVMQPVSDTSDMDAMLRGLAHKLTLMPITRECGGPWDQYLDASIDLCRRFEADAAVFAGHMACKGNWAVIKLVKDRIADELGIPTLVLELDLFDPRVLGTESLMNRFEMFIETLLTK